MFFQFNIIGVIFILASLMALNLVVYSYHRREDNIFFYFAFFAFFCFIDFFCQGMECLTTPFMVKSFLGQASAIGYLFITPVWLMLSYSLTHERKLVPKKFLYLILIIPLIGLFLVLTNPWLHLYFTSITLPTAVYDLQLTYNGTWGFLLIVAYELLIAILIIYLFLKAIFSGKTIYRRTYSIGLIATLLTVTISLLTLTPLYPGFDFIVVSYIVTLVFLYFAIILYDAFDIMPLVNSNVIDEIDVGILFFDSKNVLVNVNPASEQININESNLKSKVEDLFKDNQGLLNFYNDNDLENFEYNFGDKWFDINKQVMMSDDEYIGKIITITDITSRKYELEQKDMLVKEVHHRVKNNLQIILSLLNLDLRFNPDDPISAINDTRSRLNYMANLHEKLYTSGDATEVNLKDYLPDIARSLLNMYDSNINVFESIDSCLIDLDLAVSLGLILTEIINNTVKYAFPNNEEGHFFIKFHQKKDMGVLEFFDDGVGLPEGFDFDSSNGLGMTVIKTLTNQIEGESEIVSDKGAHFKIVFPL